MLHLDATTAVVTWLTFLGQLAPALLALRAGVLGDRYSERRQMVTGDLGSAAVLASVPVSAALGVVDSFAAPDRRRGPRSGERPA
ncbi:hypothetical protein ACFQ6B_02115 [Streptomyces wedmorensis]|uniref:MFS transporter n=1 Tax=Streptomyces wedmorensis TaxID=43759 RepID=A0ABW6IT30_STRWE